MENLTLQQDVLDFLRESNNIEDVWDDLSLAQAISAWNYIIQEPKLDVSVILKTHKILMLTQHLLPNEKGYFRKVPVWIGGREGKPWFVIPELIDQWCKIANQSKTEEQIKQDHIQFETYHPWVDGNGRGGRILMNWQRVKSGLPILIIKETEKKEYYKWFP